MISFIKQIINHELGKFKDLKKVDFHRDDSLIGKLFYRVFKSQEKNMDTICCILAELMNQFIAKQQDFSGLNQNQTNKAGDHNRTASGQVG